MKKNFRTILAFMLISSAMLPGCNQNSPTPSVTQQITGKWNLATAVSEVTLAGTSTAQIQSTPFTSADYMDFKSDGTVTIVETGKTYNGKWAITANKLILSNTGYMDFPNGFELPVLTTADLQLYYKITDAVGVTVLKLNLKK